MKYLLSILLSLAAIVASLFMPAPLVVSAQGISQLPQFIATTSPYSAITVVTNGKNIYAPYSSATTSRMAANTFCINLATPDCITAWPTGGGGGNWFTPTTYGNSTSTTLGLLNGFTSPASSTIAGDFHLALSNGGLGINGGLVYSGATTTAGTGLTYSGNAFNCNTASGSVFGCLASADWTIFNSKESALSFSYPLIRSVNAISFSGLSTTSPWTQGQLAYVNSNNTLTSVATGTISANAPLSVTAGRYAVGGNAAFSITQSGSGADGYLSSTDWTLFNNKISSTSLSATLPITYSSATGVIACPTCSVSASAFPFTADSNYGALTNSTSTPVWFKAGLQASSTANLVYASSTALTVSGTGYFGTVGIGTTSPYAPLSVAGQSVFNYITATGTTASTFVGVITSTATAPNTFPFASTTAISSSGAAYFATSGGNVGVGTTTPNAKFMVYTGAAGIAPSATADNFVVEGTGDVGLSFLTTPTGSNRFIFGDSDNNLQGGIIYDHATDNFIIRGNNSIRLTIESDGALLMNNIKAAVGASNICYDGSGGSYWGACSSLLILKMNITDASLGLKDLKKLRVVEYDWNPDKIAARGHNLGFIAEEVQQATPILSEYAGGDGKLSGWNQMGMIALSVKSIQQLDARVTALETPVGSPANLGGTSLSARIASVKRSAEENWQWDAISALLGVLIWQHWRIRRLEKLADF